MSRWRRGAAEVDELLREQKLERVSGSAASGATHLASAHALLLSAARERSKNPEAAYILAYDAARKAATGLLAQQGLRPNSGGHHYTVERAVRAQFDGSFDAFGALRRRRAEIEYPRRPGDDVSEGEAAEAIDLANGIVRAAGLLMQELGVF